MNAFDFVVTAALGSTLASIVLSKDVALLEGGAADPVAAREGTFSVLFQGSGERPSL